MSRRKNIVNFDYKMNGAVLGRTDSIKDLGIDITYNLVWNDHIRRVVSKYNKKMGMVKREIGFNAPEKVSQTLFTALVRSDVEYGSPLWSGTSKRNLQLLEGVQRRATNYILRYPDQDYDGRLTKLDLLPLSYRREINDLCFFFRCKLELYELDLNHFVVFNYTLPDRPNTKSSDDPLLLVPQFCKTESHKASIGLFLCGIFFNRIVPMWNQLPLSIRTTALTTVAQDKPYHEKPLIRDCFNHSMASFKSQLTEFYKWRDSNSVMANFWSIQYMHLGVMLSVF